MVYGAIFGIEHLFGYIFCGSFEYWKELTILKYYAGYDSMTTDVAVFNTKEERDEWVEDESAFDRIRLKRKEALMLVGKNAKLHTDEFNEHIIWMINPFNIINK